MYNSIDAYHYPRIIVYNNTIREESAMLEISEKTNLLEQKSYRYQLQDVSEPNLYRDVYNYEEVPRVAFNHRRVPIGMPDEMGYHIVTKLSSDAIFVLTLGI